MKAWCIDCQQEVEAGDNFMVCSPAPGSNVMREICECVGNENCRGDDLHADDFHNDPRRGQSADINRSNKR